MDKELEREEKQMALKDNEVPVCVNKRGPGRPRKPDLTKTNLDLTDELIKDLDKIAAYLGTSRQAVIKNFIMQGLDAHIKARKKA